MRRSILAAIRLALVAMAPAACGTEPQVPTFVSVTPETLVMFPGRTHRLSVTVLDAGRAPVVGAAVAWSSSNDSVVTVSDSGVVAAVGPLGTAAVLATVATIAAQAAVRVTVDGGSLDLVPDAGEILVGEMLTLTAALTDDAGWPIVGPSITFGTNDASVATVTAEGVVTGIGVGEARISASVGSLADTTDIGVLGPPAKQAADPTAAARLGRYPSRGSLIP